jgi:hypothetical protein
MLGPQADGSPEALPPKVNLYKMIALHWRASL